MKLSVGLGISQRHAPAGGEAQPPVMDSLKVWLDANQESYANDAEVTTWTDRSGEGNDAVESANPLVNPPIFKTAVQNGKPGVLFTNDFVVAPLPWQGLFSPYDWSPAGAAEEAHFFIVMKPTAADHDALGAYPLAFNDINILQILGGTADPGNTSMAFGNSTPTLSVDYLDRAFILSAKYENPTATQMEKTYLKQEPDGLSDVKEVSGGPIGTGSVRIGSFNDVDYNGDFTGHIFEILIYNRKLTDQENIDTIQYLRDKWGI